MLGQEVSLNPRPPKKWWDTWFKRMKKQYPRAGENAKEYKKRISAIVGSIWSGLKPTTKKRFLKYYANPMLPMPPTMHIGKKALIMPALPNPVVMQPAYPRIHFPGQLNPVGYGTKPLIMPALPNPRKRAKTAHTGTAKINPLIIILVVAAAGLVAFFIGKKVNASGGAGQHLWFTVQYSNWPEQEIDITAMVELNPTYTVADLRTLYSSNGYTIIREYYK